MQFVPISTKEDITKLANMAQEIWFEYWPDIIGLAQTEYMVENFQSELALTNDITNKGYLYWFLLEDARIVGYTGARPEEETNKLFISKIYLYSQERGKGFASQTIDFYEQFCRENNLSAMYLTVNKGNDLAVRAYLGKGFETINSVETDIGKGFIMDDYIMQKAFV